jgi:hypothetical protein
MQMKVRYLDIHKDPGAPSVLGRCRFPSSGLKLPADRSMLRFELK